MCEDEGVSMDVRGGCGCGRRGIMCVRGGHYVCVRERERRGAGGGSNYAVSVSLSVEEVCWEPARSCHQHAECAVRRWHEHRENV